MAVDLSNRNVKTVLERAGMLPPSPRVLGQLHAACAGVDGYTDAVLDISLVRAPDDLPGGEALFVLMREKVVLVTMRKPGIFKPAEPKTITIPLATFKDFWQDDETAKHAMGLLGRDPDDSLVFVWRSADERYRMFPRSRLRMADGMSSGGSSSIRPVMLRISTVTTRLSPLRDRAKATAGTNGSLTGSASLIS